MRLRILLVTTGLTHGGAERQVSDMALNLRMRGHAVTIISMLRPEAFEHELVQGDVALQCVNMRRGAPNPLALFKFRKMVETCKPDVVHAHMYHANLFTRISRMVVRFPVLICTAHNTYEAPTGRSAPKEVSFREVAYRCTDWLCDLTTQVSRVGLERYIKVKAVPRRKMQLMYNGVQLERFRHDVSLRNRSRSELGARREFLWLSVGRLEAAKDYPTLLKAFAMLQPNSCKLYIAGQGSMSQTLVNLSRELGVAPSVRFLGLRTDIPALMAAADGYVSSSALEGLPLVLIEAAASGIPAIATDVGGANEVILSGRTGLLVQPRSPVSLAEGMRSLMQMSMEERTKIGLNASVHVREHFCIQKIITQWERLYSELASAQKVKNCQFAYSN